MPQLIEIAAAGAPADRRRALDALAAIGPDAAPAVPLLIGLLDRSAYDGAPNADQAVQVLGAIGPAAAEAVPALLEVLASHDRRTDEAPRLAPSALGRIGDPRAIPALMAAAAGPPDVLGPGRPAIAALREFRHQARQAAPLLLELLADERYDDYHYAIIETLVRIGPADGPAWDIICAELAAAEDGHDRMLVARRLHHLLGSGGSPHPTARALFAGLADDPDPGAAHWARLALEALDRGAAG